MSRSRLGLLLAAALAILALSWLLWWFPPDTENACEASRPVTSVARNPDDDPVLLATRQVVAWIAEGKSLPGCDQKYADSKIMGTKTRFLVTCNFLPPEAVISTNPKVVRVSKDEFDRWFALHGYDGTDYLSIDWIEVGAEGNLWGFQIKNMFGYLAGHGYRIVFTRTDGKIRTETQCLWTT